MSPARPLPRPCAWVWTFCFFLVFSRFWPNCKKPWKNKKKQKQKKFRPMSPARPLPRPCPWVWTFCFFCFFWFSRAFGQTAKNNGNTKRNKKNKKFRPMSPARPLPRPCPWVWTFLFFLVFSRFWPNCKKPWKNQKKQKKKSSDPCPQPGLSPDLAHGSELFVFFCFFFPVFPYFFACVSCEYAFITVRLKKCAFLQFAHLRPPGQIAKKAWKTKLHLMTYIMTNVMIIYIYISYIYHDVFNK